MTLQQLQYVVALDTHRHFVKAAESCFVAQPTLTLQVKKLEEEVHLTLFDRSVKPLEPTPQGARFIVRARQILREVEGLKEMVNQDRQSVEGNFKIGIIPTLAPYILPLFLKVFQEKLPKVSLEILELQSDVILEQLRVGQLDIGLLVTPTHIPQLREIKLFQEPFWVFAAEGHKLLKKQAIDAAELPKEDLWLLQQGHCFRDQILNVCQTNAQETTQPIQFKTGSIETLKRMIQNHKGFTLIPELAIDIQDQKWVRPFKDPQPARQIGMVVHGSFTKEVLLKELRDSIIHSVPDHFTKSHEYFTVQWR
ncbi:LysR family transcriptional regulator, hydrogen peroxide-inducible genes activator [Pustulibacterium marinum]|uniref:LysR family transcriptional regulator, hydrogen peroxide-inducible genes activator n=1 Tax=Pustulibacterium marinum TaxID=1224947 RepID=A0A1I7IME5_9FLAO|nr:hydrogen peroxide-inducible genes activator [Pustulibacterium marinum]SFU74076.1 LysR family transcriptional regulator, hydrogen peroxide-inducible genes activator [Pustulibacterium marinum]